MSKVAFAFALLGLALAVALMHRIGFSAITEVLSSAGSGIVLFVLAHALSLFAGALAWSRLMPKERRPGIGAVLQMRWIGESVNNLLPGRLGGDFVRAMLAARRGLRSDEAGASVLVDVTLGLVSEIFLGALGLVLLAWLRPGPPLIGALSGLVLLGAVAGLAIAAERLGWLGELFRWVGRSRFAPPGEPEAVAQASAPATKRAQVESRRSWRAALRRRVLADGDRLDRAVRTLYGRRRALVACGLLRLVVGVAGALEVWVGAAVLGHPLSPPAALIVGSLAVLVRSIAFGVPAGLGVQEGSFVVLGRLVDLPPETALALALMCRIRELALGLPGLALWAAPGLSARSRARPRPASPDPPAP
jgi:putative membrane protein